VDDRNKEGFGQIKSKAEEFLQIFRKGEEFTQELLKENEKLRFKLVQIEEENHALRGAEGGRIKSMQEKLDVLEEENRRLMEHYRAAELENKNFAEKYLEVEQENNNSANSRGKLPAAFHAGFQRGAEDGSRDNHEPGRSREVRNHAAGRKTNLLAAVAAEGVSVEEMPQIGIGDG
jgi:hypothetical protein